MMAWVPGNVLVALAAAASWGGGDFSGGMAVKTAGGSTRGALQVVILSHAVSLAVLLAIFPVWYRGRLDEALLAWGLAGGVAAGASLSVFYIALSRGAMGVAAAVSGLLAAAIPALVSRMIEGAPAALRLVGFALAAAAIWMIAAGPSPENAASSEGPGQAAEQRKTMALAVIGGLGFGFYFVALRMDDPLGVFEPLALARAASIATCAAWLVAMSLTKNVTSGGGIGERQGTYEDGSPGSRSGPGNPRLSRSALGWVLGVALLDTGGNLLFIAATRMGRLDVVAVLASLYPASTILLAAWRLHERPTPRQTAGMGIALAAVVMITL